MLFFVLLQPPRKAHAAYFSGRWGVGSISTAKKVAVGCGAVDDDEDVDRYIFFLLLLRCFPA